MNIDQLVMAFAGTVALVGTLLGVFANPWFLLLPAFVGANMLQASFTGFCPAAMLFKKLGVPTGAAFCEKSCCCAKDKA